MRLSEVRNANYSKVQKHSKPNNLATGETEAKGILPSIFAPS